MSIFQLGGLLVAVACAAEDGQRAQLGDEQIAAAFARHVGEHRDARQFAKDGLVEHGRLLHQLARGAGNALGKRLRVHAVRSDEQEIVAGSERLADVERARLCLVHRERQVGPRREDAGAVPEDGEEALLVRRQPVLVDDQEILAPIAVQIGGHHRRHFALDAQRLGAETGSAGSGGEKQRENDQGRPSLPAFARDLLIAADGGPVATPRGSRCPRGGLRCPAPLPRRLRPAPPALPRVSTQARAMRPANTTWTPWMSRMGTRSLRERNSAEVRRQASSSDWTSCTTKATASTMVAAPTHR